MPLINKCLIKAITRRCYYQKSTSKRQSAHLEIYEYGYGHVECNLRHRQGIWQHKDTERVFFGSHSHPGHPCDAKGHPSPCVPISPTTSVSLVA